MTNHYHGGPRRIEYSDLGVTDRGNGIYWIEECLEEPMQEWLTEDRVGKELGSDWYDGEAGVHQQINAFLLCGTERALLFDTMSRVGETYLLDSLEEILGEVDVPLEYVVFSHDEVAHAGNAYRVKQEYPDARLVGANAGSHPMLHNLQDAELVDPEETIDLGGYEVEFVEPVFVDAAPTTWLFERTTRTLFSVDSFGQVHHDYECTHFTDEIETPMASSRFLEYTGRSMQWLPYSNTDVIKEELDTRLEQYDPTVIAPSHGCIIRKDVRRAAEMVKENIDWVLENGTLQQHTQAGSGLTP